MGTNQQSGEKMAATFNTYTTVGTDGQVALVVAPADYQTGYYAYQNPSQSGIGLASAAMVDNYTTAATYNSEYSQQIYQQYLTQNPGGLIGPPTIGQFMSTVLKGNGATLGLTQAQSIALMTALNSGVSGTQNIYTQTGAINEPGMFSALWVYTIQTCALSPVAGACELLAERAAALVPAPLISSAPDCPKPITKTGRISASAAKTAPLYPLVIGQDETKRGADVNYTISIEPTAYTTYTARPQYKNVRTCSPVTGACTSKREFVEWKCIASTTYYRESVASVRAGASLTQESREWIQSGDLQIHYPGAFLHQPDFILPGGNGNFLGNTFAWNLSGNLQVADPGEFRLTISGITTGTPVHGPRTFQGGGSFLTYLREAIMTK